MNTKVTFFACLALGSTQVAAASITFTDVKINGFALTAGVPLSNPNPLIDQSTYNVPVLGGNSLTFSTPNAIVGDASPLASGSMVMSYIASSGPAMVAVNAISNIGAPAIGSGFVVFTENVYSYDCNTMAVGPLIGSLTHTFNALANPNFSGTISLSTPSNCIYVEKVFQLSAVNTSAFDFAAVSINNQSIEVVPEPASLAAIGLGLAYVIRRRRA